MHLPVALVLAVGALVTASAGLLERYVVVTPHPLPAFQLFFSDPLYVKAWLASAVLVLSGGQLITAAGMYGMWRIARAMRFYPVVHRWSGRVAMGLTVPVAVHCLFDLGYYPLDLRVMAHAILGAFLYGIFAAKLLLILTDRAPWWVLPVAGGALFTAILGLWLTSSYWLFTLYGWHL